MNIRPATQREERLLRQYEAHLSNVEGEARALRYLGYSCIVAAVVLAVLFATGVL